jgi:hypothetical protein
VADRNVQPEALVDLVAAYAAEIVTLRIEENPLEGNAAVSMFGGSPDGQRVDGLERLFLVLRGILAQRVLEQRPPDGRACCS